MEDTTTVKTVTTEELPTAGVRKEHIYTATKIEGNYSAIAKVDQLVWFIISVIEILITIRFALLLLGARDTELVSIIYSVSRIFILPFTGIFAAPTFNGSFHFDTASILGLIAWLIVGFLIVSLVHLFSKPTED